MSDNPLEQRLGAIEARLALIEQALAPQPPPPTPAVAKPAPAREAWPRPAPAPRSSFDTTQILGWSGATALVLAAIYLIRLGIDSGWLTPVRQLAIAVFGAAALIGGGLLLRRTTASTPPSCPPPASWCCSPPCMARTSTTA